MNLSRTDFNAIRAKAKARKEKRQEKAATLWTKKIKSVNKRNAIRSLKKTGLEIWSLVVRNRDGNRCIMCGSEKYLNAHHWLFRKSHSVRLSLEPANGATLCAYPCHLGRIHHDGDGDFMLKLADKMISIVGQLKIDEMREIARHPSPVGLHEIEGMVEKLRNDYKSNR